MINFDEQEFTQLKKINSGTFGTVMHNNQMAFKRYHSLVRSDFEIMYPNPCLKEAKNKFKLMKIRQSKIKYTDLVIDTLHINNIFSGVCYPYYDGQILEKIITTTTFNEKIKIIKKLLRNAQELTKNKIYPLDYKLNNIIYTKKGQVKIMDLDDKLTKVTLIRNPLYYHISLYHLKETILKFLSWEHFYMHDRVLNYLEDYNYFHHFYYNPIINYKSFNHYLKWRSKERSFIFIEHKDLKSNINIIKKLLQQNNTKLVIIFDEYQADYCIKIFEYIKNNNLSIFDILIKSKGDYLNTFVNSYNTISYFNLSNDTYSYTINNEKQKKNLIN